MTLIIALKIKDEIIMSADSRLTKVPVIDNADDKRKTIIEDNVQKIWNLSNKIGISNCGSWPVTEYKDGHFSKKVSDFISCFEKECDGLSIDALAKLFAQQVYADKKHIDTSFIISGFNSDISRIYNIWYNKASDEPNADLVDEWIWFNGNYRYAGILSNRFLEENDLTPRTLSEVNAVRLIKYVIEESENMLHQNEENENIGGPIDILRVNKDGCSWIQHK